MRILILLFLLVSCSSGREDLKGKILLPVKEIKSGYDSECTAIVNALNYLGYDVNEEFVFGVGGGLFFSFAESAFPFIAIKSDTISENFFKNTKIKWSGKKYESNKKSWEIIKEKLKEGIPLILRVDVRYLPYRYGGKYGGKLSSYGKHYIILFGIDYEKRVALIADNNSTNLIEISLNDLDKARNSSTQAFPPYGEFFWIEKEDKLSFSYRDLLLESLKDVVKNYEKPVKKNLSDLKVVYGISAIKGLSKEIVEIERLVNFDIFLPGVFYSFYHYIEQLETKGSANREIFKDYLIHMNAKLKDKDIEKMIKQLSLCIDNWKVLSEEFKNISSNIKNYKEKYERKPFYDRAGAIADSVATEEEKFYKMIKNYLEK